MGILNETYIRDFILAESEWARAKQQTIVMPVWLWRNASTYSQTVEVQIATATIETSVQGSPKVRINLLYDPDVTLLEFTQ